MRFSLRRLSSGSDPRSPHDQRIPAETRADGPPGWDAATRGSSFRSRTLCGVHNSATVGDHGDAVRTNDCKRGEGIATLAGARRAEAIVSAIEPDDRYPGIARREATDVAASRCRRSARAIRGGSPNKAIVRPIASRVPESHRPREPQGANAAARQVPSASSGSREPASAGSVLSEGRPQSSA